MQRHRPRAHCSIAATGKSTRGGQKNVIIYDVAGACLNTPSLVPTFVSICEVDSEEGDEDKCGQIRISMYGTRPAV